MPVGTMSPKRPSGAKRCRPSSAKTGSVLIRPRPHSGNRPESAAKCRSPSIRRLRPSKSDAESRVVLRKRCDELLALGASGLRDRGIANREELLLLELDVLPRRVAEDGAEAAVPPGDVVDGVVPTSQAARASRWGRGAGTPGASGRTGTPPASRSTSATIAAACGDRSGPSHRSGSSTMDCNVAVVGQVTPVAVRGHTNAAHQASACSLRGAVGVGAGVLPAVAAAGRGCRPATARLRPVPPLPR